MSTVSINQLVSANVRRARMTRGWTQATLAAQLNNLAGPGAWTEAAVSSAERAASHYRVKSWSANELAMLSQTFALPIGYFMLPGEIDAGLTYSILDKDGEQYGQISRAQILESIAPSRDSPLYAARLDHERE